MGKSRAERSSATARQDTGRSRTVGSRQRSVLTRAGAQRDDKTDRTRIVSKSGEPLDRCPGSPNCVCSEFPDDPRFIEPFVCCGDVDAEWQRLAEILAAFPQTYLIEQTDDRLKAECRTLICRFVDDLEFRLDRTAGRIHVRSSSRLGRWDLGTNRRRIETLRQLWNGDRAVSKPE